jgi:preprotein translocase subunit SecE
MHPVLLPLADAPPFLDILLGLVLIAAIALIIVYRQVIKRFTGEVRTELLKASWPWDPKEHGFKRYKELVDSTMVVVVAMLLLAGYISLCDFCLTTIVGALTHNGTFNR